MQIDVHHAMTYIAARFAGYKHKDALIISYSAQYVDDATNAGVIRFDNGAMYSRISSAHKTLDYRNSLELANHRVWIPFHFLPGNAGMDSSENVEGSFINKLVCYPNSYVARDMLLACACDYNKPYWLHRIGITMHVYADTWAHQGFAGVNHKINEVNKIKSNDKSLDKKFLNRIKNYFLSEMFPLGHGAALSYPDKPYLIWEYNNGFGKKVRRNNPIIFLEAVDNMCRAMRCFIEREHEMHLESVPGIPKKDKKVILSFLQNIKKDDKETRHNIWLKKIRDGAFSFGAANVCYVAKGRNSWKYKAIGQLKAVDTGKERFKYQESFLLSHWKCFHDALQAHRFDILHNILPKYGICAA